MVCGGKGSAVVCGDGQSPYGVRVEGVRTDRKSMAVLTSIPVNKGGWSVWKCEVECVKV